MKISNPLFAQSAAMGALDQLYAAVAPSAESGKLYGPDGFGEMRGYPIEVEAVESARNEATARRLWDVSEELTGVRWKLAGTSVSPRPST
jgi:hypothetical protein